jgi:acyl-coenzyme A thioesterase PaaI-like protein
VPEPGSTTKAADRPRRPPGQAGARLLSLWQGCRRLPFGRTIFGALFARQVPYSGSIGAAVLALAPGHARLALRDRRAVRNHLGSIHAVALINLGELASGLAMTAAMPAGVRGIVTRIETEYRKKARGTLVAESRVEFPQVAGDTDLDVRAEIRDTAGDVVATVLVKWRLGLAR